VRPMIFDPFFTTKDVGRGSGQGLPLARGVVQEGHGGTLAVESVLGEGTTFSVRIPVDGLAEKEAVGAVPRPQRAAGGELGGISHRVPHGPSPGASRRRLVPGHRAR